MRVNIAVCLVLKKMEASSSCEMLPAYQTTQCLISEDHNLGFYVESSVVQSYSCCVLMFTCLLMLDIG